VTVVLGLQPKLGQGKKEWARNKLKQEKGLNIWGSEEQLFLGLLT
jgi:hypothetical protein